MSEIDPVRFGELIQAMRSLERELVATRGEVSALEDRLTTMEGRFRLGRAGITGLAIGLGFAIFGVRETVLTLWGKL